MVLRLVVAATSLVWHGASRWKMPNALRRRQLCGSSAAVRERIWNPGTATSFLYLGLARYRLKQVDAALIAFQEAVQCDRRLFTAHLALGKAYAGKGNDAEAIAAYERALSLEPRNREALRGAALIYARD